MSGWWTRLLAILGLSAALGTVATATAAGRERSDGNRSRHSSCRLGVGSDPNVRHVIYVVWDNTHLLRDNPNVPSDLQQMPHLLNFLRGSGSLLSNDHTPLIAHTADDIVTSLTGVYPDRHGLNVANNYGYFNSDGKITFPSDFTYWTDPVQTSDTQNPPPNLVTQNGKNAPAPWVPFTRAGCNVGSIASGDISLENTSTGPSGDITRVFGSGTPQWTEAQKEDANGAPSGLASANFEGLAVHCARNARVCRSGETDALPDEPGGYSGFKGLFGAVQVDPVLTGQGDTTSGGYERSPAVNNLDGKPITDSNGNAGFPGFDSQQPTNALAYVAGMQEHGVPVTFAYLTDAHDDQQSGNAFGPGEAGYVAQLKSYDDAFAKFFSRLNRDGITKRNTLFVFTSDEGDHFVGSKPTNPGCDGVNNPCTYKPGTIGEIDANIQDLLAKEKNNHTKFDIHFDSAPAFYVDGQPGPTDSLARQLERDTAGLMVGDPLINEDVYLTNYLADPTELRNLHMETGDARRNPTFVQFANPNYYLETYGCPTGAPPGCPSQYAGDAWNHGDYWPEINRTWLGMVGPGVRPDGQTAAVWADHADTRPTMLELLGLRDDYQSEGRVLSEMLSRSITPSGLRERWLRPLQRIYKQLNAPVGRFAAATLRASTGALRSNDTGDATYGQCESDLSSLGARRDALAAQIENALSSVEFGHGSISRDEARSLVRQGQQVLDDAGTVAAFCTP